MTGTYSDRIAALKAKRLSEGRFVDDVTGTVMLHDLAEDGVSPDQIEREIAERLGDIETIEADIAAQTGITAAEAIEHLRGLK